MIIGSVLLVLIAFLLLFLGVGRGSGALYSASILSSLFAAVVLIAAVRPGRARALPLPPDPSTPRPAVGRAEVRRGGDEN